MSQPEEVLVDAPGCECQDPIAGKIEELRLEIADLHHDHIGERGFQPQDAKVREMVERFAAFGDYRSDAAAADNDLCARDMIIQNDSLNDTPQGGRGTQLIDVTTQAQFNLTSDTGL